MACHHMCPAFSAPEHGARFKRARCPAWWTGKIMPLDESSGGSPWFLPARAELGALGYGRGVARARSAHARASDAVLQPGDRSGVRALPLGVLATSPVRGGFPPAWLSRARSARVSSARNGPPPVGARWAWP